MMRASERRRGHRARGRRGGHAAPRASRWPSRPASPRRSTGPRPRRSSTSRARRWPDAFRRAIGVALKDEEDLRFLGRPARRRSWRRRRRERLDLPARRAALRRASRRSCAPTASPSRPSRPRPSSPAVGLLGPRSIEDIRRAARRHARAAARAPRPISTLLFDSHFLGRRAAPRGRSGRGARTTRSGCGTRARGGEAPPDRTRQRGRSGGDRPPSALSARRLGGRRRCRGAAPLSAAPRPSSCRSGAATGGRARAAAPPSISAARCAKPSATTAS